MKTFLFAGSLACGALCLYTGSAWYLLPQYVGLFAAFTIQAIDVYDYFNRKA